MGLFQVGVFLVGVFLGGSCPGGTYPGWEFSLLEVFRVGIIRVAVFRVAVFMLPHFETWWWNKDVDVTVCRRSYLGFGKRVGMRKIGRNILRQQKMLRE